MATPETAPSAPPAVISALRREIAPLLRQAQVASRIRTSHGRFVRARLGQRDLILGWTGDGHRSAADGLRALLAACDAGRLIVVGVAGGLSPALTPAQLVVAAEVRDSAGLAPPPDPATVERALAAGDAGSPEVAEGLIYSSPSIVGTATGKVELWRALGEPAGAVVDLETATWARIAAEQGVPYLAVRTVSDGAGDDLPLDFELYRDDRGRVTSSRVALRAVLEPALIGPLRRLEKRVDDCAARLASWAISFLA